MLRRPAVRHVRSVARIRDAARRPHRPSPRRPTACRRTPCRPAPPADRQRDDAMTGRIVVVGLGPGRHRPRHRRDARRRSSGSRHRFLRTARHPSASLVGRPDDVRRRLRAADTFDDVYAEIADRLVDAALEHGEILYAVPGSPLVLERTVRYLRERCADPRPTSSSRSCRRCRSSTSPTPALGIDPVEAGVRLVDGHEFATAAAGERGPLLVAHTHANWVLSRHQARRRRRRPATSRVAILQALGTPDEAIVDTTWAELDRTVEADHLTSIYIPELADAGRRRVRPLPPARPHAARAVPVGHRADPRIADPVPARGDLRGGRRAPGARRRRPGDRRGR